MKPSLFFALVAALAAPAAEAKYSKTKDADLHCAACQIFADELLVGLDRSTIENAGQQVTSRGKPIPYERSLARGYDVLDTVARVRGSEHRLLFINHPHHHHCVLRIQLFLYQIIKHR
eukprot:TRINITY_DN1991_c0_g3_i4.p1 TRINITY_DN1991_c0_g3~~TRINITY_DN1991_c0_g3_i4.p1  ORF type:complete len:118 (-),score=20.98 TRINITY_DN1991_c0_g3_i4:68-421(-)